MVAQFVGGAKLFEAVTGYSYEVGLAIFGIAAILFTALGGFRGVAFVDTLCGIAMIVGIFVLAGGILNAGGGYTNIMENLQTHNPQLLDPLGGGDMLLDYISPSGCWLVYLPSVFHSQWFVAWGTKTLNPYARQ